MPVADQPLAAIIKAYRDLLPLLGEPLVPGSSATAFSSAMSDIFRYIFLLETAVTSRNNGLSGGGQRLGEDFFENNLCPGIFFEALFSLSPMSAVLTDDCGIVLRVNPAFLELFGYRHHEVFLREINELVAVSPVIRELATGKQESGKPDRKPQSLPTTREKKDGTPINVIFTEIPFRSGNNSFTFCIYQDISERLQSKRSLRMAESQLERTLETTLQAFSLVIEERDRYTAEHQRKVAFISMAVGKEMALDLETTRTLYVASLLHDIGKISVPAQILSKPGLLNETERNIIKGHPGKSFEIVRTMDFAGPVAECVLQHHERLDGSGYPKGLHGDEIILPAQILAVADVFEAMVSHRPHRPARDFSEALDEMKCGKGIIYNSLAVEKLENLVLSGEMADNLNNGMAGYHSNYTQ